jgi:radical SAM protein with 4Fe4S-binding SPASM domain
MELSIPEGNIEELQRKLMNVRFPLACDFELTFKCNLKCVHCFLFDHKGTELSYEEVCRILDEIVEEGCLGLIMTGGEVLLRKDFLDIYDYAYEKKLRIDVFTNGTLITPEIADHFQMRPPHFIEISLYGITNETYEKITRVPGSFKKCINGISLLHNRGIPVNLKTVALTLNVSEIAEMKSYATKLGVGFRVSTNILPKFNRSKEPCKFRLTPKDAVEVKSMVYGSNTTMIKEHKDKCGGGKSQFHIDPYGNISICLLYRKYDYNLRYVTFREAWQNLKPAPKRARDSQECLSCEARSVCDQCPAWAYLENGSCDVPSDWVCQFTKLAKAKIETLKEGINIPKGGEIL